MKQPKFASFIFWFLFLVLPFFFLPITFEFYNFNKLSLLFLTSVVCFCAWIFSALVRQSIYINLSKTDIFIVIFLLTLTVVNFVSSPTLVSFTSVHGPLSYWILFFLYLFFKSHYEKPDREKVLLGIALVGSILGILQSAFLLGLWKNLSGIASLPEWLTNIYWSPLGSSFNTFSYLLFTTAVSFLIFAAAFHHYLLEGLNETKASLSHNKVSGNKILLTALLLTINLSTLLINGYYLYVVSSVGKPFSLDLASGWFVLTSALTDVKTAFVGVGAGNFNIIFSANRPPLFRGFLSSQLYPDNQATYVFHLISEYGLAGFLAFVLMFFHVFNSNSRETDVFLRLIKISLVALGIIFLFTGLNLSLVYLFFVILFLDQTNKGKLRTFKTGIPLELQHVTIFLIFLLVLGLSYAFSRFYLASYYYRQASNSQTKRITVQTYDFLFKSINQNPYNFFVHDFLALVSRSSAENLIRQKDFAKDQNKQNTAVNLLNQAVREEKTAISLQNSNPNLWYDLAQIYSLLSVLNPKNFSGEAVKSFNEALSRDPRNPVFHFSLGSFYLSQNNYPTARNEFLNTISLDPSFANAYYNLYIVDKNLKAYEEGLNALRQTTNLLPATHNQYDQLVKELSEYEKFVKEATQTGSLKNQNKAPAP